MQNRSVWFARGSASVSDAGFGVPPKQSFLNAGISITGNTEEKSAIAGRAPQKRETHALPRRLRLRQMRHAIFLAIARDAKIEIRIGQLRRAADRAAMQRFVVAA